jgi:UDP-GlcNAc:undecaprenyl-phosphate/decaprenyl-phosphate GlcNAc-1-phosphate transferase
MSALPSEIGEVVLALVCAWGIPAVGMRLLVPTLDTSSWVVPNYRGRSVFLGLGIVWAFWVLGIASSWVATDAIGVPGATLQATPVILVLLALAFGLVDDVLGARGEKGFRGHLRAMAHGRLTTGGLKIVGIGSAALWTAVAVATRSAHAATWSRAEQAAAIIAGTVLIAGSANLINLLDLRPGRALKGYLLLIAVGYGFGVAATVWRGQGAALSTGAGLIALAIWFVGPVLAVWRFDLGERGMLGDAGANAAGALAGYLMLVLLPLWGIVAAAVVVSALNLASERVSFSQVIGGNRALAWMDRLGRLPDESPPLTEIR